VEHNDRGRNGGWLGSSRLTERAAERSCEYIVFERAHTISLESIGAFARSRSENVLAAGFR
jgi:hypothetical protein